MKCISPHAYLSLNWKLGCFSTVIRKIFPWCIHFSIDWPILCARLDDKRCCKCRQSQMISCKKHFVHVSFLFFCIINFVHWVLHRCLANWMVNASTPACIVHTHTHTLMCVWQKWALAFNRINNTWRKLLIKRLGKKEERGKQRWKFGNWFAGCDL